MANFTLNEALSSIIVFIKVIRRRLDKFRNIKNKIWPRFGLKFRGPNCYKIIVKKRTNKGEFPN